MLNQELNNEVVTFVSAPTPNNMQQYGVQPPCSMQYFTPPPSAYVYSDGTPVIPTDSSPKPFPLPGPQWQEPGFVGGPGNFMPQQAAGPTGGGGQQMRLGIQPGGPPPQQGPPQSQPTPTSTPPGAPVDMKPNSHIPGQTLQQGNIDIAGMYVQNQPPRAPSGNQNFHNSYPTARLPTPRMARNPQVATMSSNNVQGIYPNPGMMAYGMMQPIPQTTIMMNVPHVSYQQATYPNQRHQGQNSNHNFYNPAPIIVGPTTQPFYPGQNYYSQLIQRPYIPPNPGTGPATQPGAPGPGPIPTLSNAPTGMVQNQQQQNLSQESKRRKHAIPIINPVTGADIFNDQPTSGNNNNVTPPGSNDSSARETPQPEPDKTVASEFAAMVAFVATAPSSPPPEVNGPPVVDNISNDNDSVHKQSVPNSDISASKVPHQLQTNVKNFVPKAQSMQQQQLSVQQQQPQQQLQQQQQSLQHIPHMVETSSLPPVQHKEEVRQSGATPIVSAVTNSPAVEIHRGDRQHKELTNLGKNVQPIVPGSLAQSPNRAPVRKQKTSESERQVSANNQPQQVVPNTVTETPPPISATEPVVPASTNKKGLKTGHKEETVSTQPKERREKSRSVSKEQSPPVSEPTVTPITVVPTPVVPAKPPSQFHNMTSIKGFTSSNIIPVPAVAPEDTPVKQQANGETQASADVNDSGNKASQKPKKNKGSKMRGDLNRKGIEKEGTDMDAFTEPAITVAEDREHASSSPPPSPVVSLKSATPAQPSPPPENKIKDDMEEREEKLVAAKNEENTKVSALNVGEEENQTTQVVIEKPVTQIALKHKYKDGQWSPINPEGKRKYERDFLMELKNEPQSRKKPENFPDWEAILKDTSNRQSRGGSMQNNMFSMRQHDMIAPQFMYKQSNSQRGQLPKGRGSQQGKAKGNKTNVIHMSLSLHEDVKLRESENAWKPKVRNSGNSENMSQEQKESEELYKKVRGILNKLTPQKFEKLMAQVRSLPINTVERLEKVIDLVFEKAVDEPGFSKAYANMCKLLADMEITYQNDEGKDVKCNFRKLIITRCQSEFESEKHAELDVEKRLEEIRNCTDPEKKKELQLIFEEDERRVRMKSVGNIRFIGELFKLNMLTTSIMFRCLQSMLKKPEEESLECLCKLLTTIGNNLENSKDAAQLNPIFNQMHVLSQKQENSKISSRVRFMLQDVIDLRKNKWVPRRDENNPKTIEQITKEAERETIEMNIALSQPRKNYDSHQDDRRGGRGGRNNNNQSEDGWQVSTGKNSYRNTNPFDQSKLLGMRKDLDAPEISLGSSTQYRNFTNFGNSAKNADKPHIATANMYSALRNDDRKPPASNIIMNKPPNRITPSPSIEKERMMYPGHKDSFDGRLSRGSSLQRDRLMQSQPQSRDNSVPRQTQPSTTAPSSRAPENLSPEEIKKYTKSIIDEYLSVKDVKDCKLNVEEKFSHNTIADFVQEAFEKGLEFKSQSRELIGNLMVELLTTGVMLKDHLIQVLSILTEAGNDMLLDIPKFWEYLAELIVPILCAEKLTFADIRTAASTVLKTSAMAELLIPIFKIIVKNMGPEFAQTCLVSSNVSLEDFLPPDSVGKFVKENNLEFLTGGPYNTNRSLPMNEVEQKLVQLMKNQSTFEAIKRWISANVGEEKAKEPLFIHTLVTAICQASFKESSSSISLDDKIFKEYGKIIYSYVDNDEELELASLNAIHALMTKLQHPQGLLLNIFNTLWEDGIISNDAFLKWRDGEDAEGKGVSCKTLVSFFVALEEAESEDES